MAPIESKIYTPEDLLAMPAGKSYELVGGRLLKCESGARSSWIGGCVFGQISDFADEHRLGWAFPAGVGYQCFTDDPHKVRRPDTSLIRFGRLPSERLPKGFVLIGPDLAAEVISPKDLVYELEAKIVDYLAAGVRLVWIINPETRTVRIQRANGSLGWLTERDQLEGEDVLPGFRCAVRDLFPPREQQSSEPRKDA
jgi:Uma2 family endonuclease